MFSSSIHVDLLSGRTVSSEQPLDALRQQSISMSLHLVLQLEDVEMCANHHDRLLFEARARSLRTRTTL